MAESTQIAGPVAAAKAGAGAASTPDEPASAAVQAFGMMMFNAVSAQNNVNMVAMAAVAKGVAALYEGAAAPPAPGPVDQAVAEPPPPGGASFAQVRAQAVGLALLNAANAQQHAYLCANAAVLSAVGRLLALKGPPAADAAVPRTGPPDAAATPSPAPGAPDLSAPDPPAAGASAGEQRDLAAQACAMAVADAAVHLRNTETIAAAAIGLAMERLMAGADAGGARAAIEAAQGSVLAAHRAFDLTAHSAAAALARFSGTGGADLPDPASTPA